MAIKDWLAYGIAVSAGVLVYHAARSGFMV